MQTRLPIGILGATGIVGQRFVQMLEHHPWFEVAWLAASDRSEGKSYAEAARWRMKTAMPDRVAGMRVSPATPEGAPKIIFAALDSSIAAELEPRFAEAGCAVVSNSSALRMQSDVPLVIPEVNSGHLKLLECQSWRRKSGGFVVTNPNCSAIGLVMALAPQELQLPSAPEQPVRYVESADRPQPRFDADCGGGMTATVGRLRPCAVLDWKFTVLSHNTIRGAAGAAVLNAELLKVQGYFN